MQPDTSLDGLPIQLNLRGLSSRSVEQWIQWDRAVECPKDRPVFGQHVVKRICEVQSRRTRNVLDHHIRAPRQMFPEMTRQGSCVGVVSATRSKPNQYAYSAACVEIGNRGGAHNA